MSLKFIKSYLTLNIIILPIIFLSCGLFPKINLKAFLPPPPLAEGTLLWEKFFDLIGADPSSLAIDNNDNIYIIGYSPLTVGNYEWVIKKIDKDGNEITEGWDKRFGGVDYNIPNKIAIDNDNNVYVAGCGENLVSPTSDIDWWIKKFDENGIEDAVNWDKKFNLGDISNIYGMCLDPDNNVFVSGIGRDLLGATNYDVHIKKFTSDGSEDTVHWNKSLDVGYILSNAKIAIDGSRNIYTGGYGWAIVTPILTGEEGFLNKLDTNGNLIWDLSFDNDNDNYHISDILFADNSIFTVGYGTNIVDTLSQRDVFIKKFSLDGNEDTVNWDIKIDGNRYDEGATTVVMDKYKNLFVAGYIVNMNDLSGDRDWFIIKFDKYGTIDKVNWNKIIEFEYQDDAVSYIDIDSNNDIYVLGYATLNLTEKHWILHKYKGPE